MVSSQINKYVLTFSKCYWPKESERLAAYAATPPPQPDPPFLWPMFLRPGLTQSPSLFERLVVRLEQGHKRTYKV